jgi:hypothetical protein
MFQYLHKFSEVGAWGEVLIMLYEDIKHQVGAWGEVLIMLYEDIKHRRVSGRMSFKELPASTLQNCSSSLKRTQVYRSSHSSVLF